MPAQLTDLLLTAASEAPGKGMVVPGGTDRSWPELLEAAQRAAGGLIAAGVKPGGRVLLLVVDISDFFPVFWGSLLAGATPVPLAPPRDRSEGERDRVLRVATKLRGPAMVVDRGVRVPGLPLLDAGELMAGEPMAERVEAPADTPALIQFSSGSTGQPRGVVLGHANVLANVEQMATAYPIRSDDIKLTWMPHWHDMGLIGCHLLPLWMRMGEVRLSPMAVFEDPIAWLRAVDTHGVTLISTTNAMMDRLNRRLEGYKPRDLELSTLRHIFNGAEPISPEVCRQLCRLTGLPETVHVPLYGLAEASVGVVAARAGGLHTMEIAGREVLLIGEPLSRVELRVVDEQGATLPEGQQGQLLFRGPNAFQGYLGDPQATAETMVEGWVRTGDLAVLQGERVAITGRHKDVVCVDGRNLHAHDVEAAAEAVPGVRANGAVAVSDRRGEVERLAVIIQPDRDHDSAPVLWAVRRAVAAAVGVEPSSVRPLPKIPRTTSGKKRRAFLAGELAAGRIDAPAPDTITLVREAWGAALKRTLSGEDLDTPFTELGGGSIEAVDVLLRLEARLGVAPDHRLLLRADTVRSMAALIEDHPPRAVPLPQARGQQPVAITGAACLLPGAHSPAAFWTLVRAGRTVIAPPPAGRWPDATARYPGGFLEDVDSFDAARFGIAPAEAAAMDPQQRLMLAVATQALEGAGTVSKQVGVFVGAGQQAYLETVLQHMDRDLPPSTITGNMLNMLAARISHHLDLRGPALAVDTACSASLVATHLAARSIAAGECEAAVVGGVNLVLSPIAHRLFERAGALSPSGRCLPFDPEADGMIPGEGAVAIVLEPLATAKARGARVLGVLLGSAMNNDGASLGVMAPNPSGQEAAIRAALGAARVEPAEVGFVEAHGTGTPIGDPVERSVLARCYPHGPRIGAVKAIVGHGLAAAGLTGLLRALDELEHEQIGAVSSFGFGGTNAHALIRGGDPADRQGWDQAPSRGPRHRLGSPSASDWVHVVRRDPMGGLSWSPCPQGPPPLVRGGAYLVTGGSGALGAHTARWLAREWSARLLLVGRRPEGTEQQRLLRELTQLGGQASYVSADLTTPDGATAVIAAAGARLGAVDGLFHLAGSTGSDAMSAKRDGLLALEPIARDLTVLFSSVSAVLPGLERGIEAYARANAWLDAWAIEQHGLGRRVVSIAWPPWEGTGMAGAWAEAFRERGLEPVAPGLAMVAMEWALGSGEPAVVVLKRGAAVATGALPEDLEERVRALVARSAEIPTAALDDDTPLMELGIDSVEAMDLLRSIEEAAGRSLPTTLLFEHDTVGKVLAALRAGVSREAEAPRVAATSAGPAPVTPGWPLLPSQQTFAVQRSFFPDIPGNVLLGVELSRASGDPAMDRTLLTQALHLASARHPALCTSIQRVGGQWRQLPGGAPPELRWVQTVDLHAIANEPFALDTGPLQRVITDGHTLVLNGHHAAVDAHSARNLLWELLIVHEALRRGEEPALPPLSSSLDEVHAALASMPDQASTAWWRARYAGGVPPLHLPWCSPTHEPARGPCAWQRRVLDRALTRRLQAMAREAGVGLPALVLAAYARCLFEASGQPDVVVRVAHGRRGLRLPDADALVGSFADSLPARMQVAAHEPLLDLAVRTQAELRAMQAHAAASSMALAELAPRSGAGPVGLTPAGFSFPHLAAPDTIGELSLGEVHGASASGFTRIGLVAWVFGDRLHCSWNFTRSHLDEDTVAGLAEELEGLLVDCASGADHAPPPDSLHARILARCRRHPERHAVEGVSYGQLERRSGALAQRIVAILDTTEHEPDPVAGPTPRVCILAPPSKEAVVAMLAVLRSGGAWVGLDPSWPAARTRQVIELARPAALIHSATLAAEAADLAPGVALLEVDEAELEGGPERSAELAHVMFTSGSTGRPKGVAVPHSAVLAFQDWVLRVFGVTERDRFVQTSSLSFGGCIRQVFSPLLAGGSVHPVPKSVARDPEALLTFMEAEGITVFNAVPSLWVHLLGAVERSPALEPLPALRWVLLGGEAVPADPVRRWRARCGWRHRLANLYGSTETVVNATWFEVAGALEPGTVHTPIGWDRYGVTNHVVDEVDGVGELVVGGGIALGYLGEPELTAEAFVELPGLGRVYRTGDLVRRDDSGAYVFLGRRDDQVQVHGNRVEPAEIEHHLCAWPEVQGAVVVQADGLLHAWLEAPGLDDPERLRPWLAERLPPAMVPHRLRVVERIPRNPAGKADRRAVRAELAGGDVGAADQPATTTPGALEDLVASTWARVLELDRQPDGGDDFFALGGDSILALEVLELLRAQLPWVPQPLALYQHPTVGGLATLLAEGGAGQRAPATCCAVPEPHAPRQLTAVQRGFWLAHRLQPAHPPCWTARVPIHGPIDPAALAQALAWLTRRQPMLRARFDESSGAPRQLIEEGVHPLLQVDDLEPLGPEAQRIALEARWQEESAARYQLDRWPLFRTRLCRLGPDEQILMVGGHHAVADAWSAWLLMGELLHAHDAFATEREPALGAPGGLPQDLGEPEPRAEDAAYWKQRLAGLTQEPAPERQRDCAARVHLGAADWEGLKRRARALQTSPFVLTITALFRALGPGDRVVSTALAARDPSDPRAASVVGPIARALPVRVQGEASVERVALAFGEAAAHAQAAPSDVLAAAGDQGLARLGRFFLSWMDPAAVPRPATRAQPDWAAGRYRFATRSTDTELMVGAMVQDGLHLDLHGGPIVEAVAPRLEDELLGLARPQAALVIYAPAGVTLPVSEPVVVERIDAAAACSELVLAPVGADELRSGPEIEALMARCLAVTGARVVALAGMLPALTGLATRSLGERPGQLLTSGHAATTVAMVLTVEKVLADTGRSWAHERVGVLGYGSIGQAVLALARQRWGEPAEVAIQDPRHAQGVEHLAGCTLILGATSGGRALDVEALATGTIVVDDSFPRAFDEAAARARMEQRGDVLLLGGGMIDAGPLQRWSPFPQAEALRAQYGARWLPGCHAEAVLLAARPDLGPTRGVVSVARALEVLEAVVDLGWDAAPLHLGSWEVPAEVVAGVAGGR
jgi:amino acid adenylation domain-containing protein